MQEIAIKLVTLNKKNREERRIIATGEDFGKMILKTLNTNDPNYHFWENLAERDDKYQKIARRLDKNTTPEEFDEITEELNNEMCSFIDTLADNFNKADETGKVNLIKDYLEDSGKDNKWHEITVLHPVVELKNYYISQENMDELSYYLWYTENREWVDLEGALDDGVIEEK